jgi:Ca2+-transporting ATPase
MPSFHQLSVQETLERLNTRLKGLSQQEAGERLKRHGLNQLEEKRAKHPVQIFLKQFKDPIILILLGAIIISLIVQELLDAAAIAAILILNAVLGFSQEYKAEKAMELLKKMSAPKAKVIREGTGGAIEAQLLVPGDIILLEAGDKVPADARVIESAEAHVNESMLTGESVPVGKNARPIRKEVPLAERKNMLFSGAIVTNGRAQAVVTETGMNTQLGKIAELVQTVEEVETPLQKRLKNLGKRLGLIVIIICLVVFGVGLLRQMPFVVILLTAISLAVAAIPEGLPAVVTIALAIGVQKMLRRNALIRELKAVETLGSVTVICSDKTGTITKNEMTVTEIFANHETITVTGYGYGVEGDFTIGEEKIEPKSIEMLLRAAASCNNATLDFGDPTEIALLVAAKKAGIEKEERVGEIPFDSKKKFMITKHKDNLWLIKGAPEKILELCSYIHVNGAVKRLLRKEKEALLGRNREMASKALRVLALAYKRDNKTILTGLAGMIDPPRQEVLEAVKLCKRAGIRVVMITGDNALTAQAIANRIGLAGSVVEATELDRKADEDLKDLAKEVTIFARVNPEHKLRILKALQASGHVVAMTGDGVNDAPALKGADVGVSMALKGTDVAREASDMVLTDDNFASIIAAVREGRVIFDNIKKFVKFLLSANFGETAVILCTLLAGMPLPLLPIQILWINLITDSLPALALGVDPAEKRIMERKPRDPKETMLKGSIAFLTVVTILAFSVTMTGFLTGCGWDTANGDIVRGRTMALMSLIFFELFLVFSCRSERYPLYEIGYFSNKWLVGAVVAAAALQFLILYTPLNVAFKITPLGLTDWTIIGGLGSLGFVVFEAKKVISRNIRNKWLHPDRTRG